MGRINGNIFTHTHTHDYNKYYPTFTFIRMRVDLFE